jgi:hypothetical protein
MKQFIKDCFPIIIIFLILGITIPTVFLVVMSREEVIAKCVLENTHLTNPRQVCEARILLNKE